MHALKLRRNIHLMEFIAGSGTSKLRYNTFWLLIDKCNARLFSLLHLLFVGLCMYNERLMHKLDLFSFESMFLFALKSYLVVFTKVDCNCCVYGMKSAIITTHIEYKSGLLTTFGIIMENYTLLSL